MKSIAINHDICRAALAMDGGIATPHTISSLATWIYNLSQGFPDVTEISDRH